MEVDKFLMRVLPKMVEPEFTAEMESALDDVAAGKQQWERYLINWNETYFAPALEAAYQSLGTSLGVASGSSRASGGRRQAVLTEIHCPKCDWLMQKILCQSKKLKADHFLKCSNSDCGTAIFWSEKKQGYELPYSERQNLPQNSNSVNPKAAVKSVKTSSNSHPKPVPQKILSNSNSKILPQKIENISSFQKTSTSDTISNPCPVCGKPLELYEYIKENQQKQMLRCSDGQARRQDDHKEAVYFTSKGVFWSPKFGEIDKQDKPQKVSLPTKNSQPKQLSKPNIRNTTKPKFL